MTVGNHAGRTYRLVPEQGEDGRRRTAIEYACGREGCTTTERIHAPLNINPEGVYQIFRRKGWHISDRNAGHCVCPACIAAGNRGTPPRKGTLSMSKLATPAADKIQQAHIKLDARDATPAEALRIFAALDEFFDEGKGRYHDGHSDKTLGDKLDIPWATIAKLRDASGLKIKTDPELVALRRDYDDLQAMLADWGKRLLTFENRASKQ